MLLLTSLILTACSTGAPAGVPSLPPSVGVASPLPRPASVMAPATAQAPTTPPAAEPPSREVDPGAYVLQWHDEWRALSPEALQREVARGPDPAARAAENVGPTGLNVRWALALLQTRSSADLVRAQSTLEQITRSGLAEAQPWRPWARMLLVRAQEQRRLEEQNERQAQQIKDQQRRLDALQDKLEALKAIERSLGPRPTAPARQIH